MSVYGTPPKDGADFLAFLQECVREHMERVHEDFEDEAIPEDETELVEADSDFHHAGEFPCLLVGPFRDGHQLYSFWVPASAVRRLT